MSVEGIVREINGDLQNKNRKLYEYRENQMKARMGLVQGVCVYANSQCTVKV